MKLPTLSGSDQFHLLVDRKMLRNGLVGNISRIHLELEPSADLDQIAHRLSINETLAQVSRLKIVHRWPMLPRWEQTDHSVPGIAKLERLSPSEFNETVLNRKVDNRSGLVFIDLCTLTDGSKHVVISMHHVLFDHQGMTNFLQAVANNGAWLPLFPEAVPSSIWQQLGNAAYMTYYMLSRSSGKLGTLIGKNVKPGSGPKFRTLHFGKEETERIEANAWKAGSRIGKSAFYMAAVANCVQRALRKRGQEPPYLWFSVPHDQRRKGSPGHLVSNQLSFLFFRLSKIELTDAASSVSAIDRQLRQQIKARITDRYADLMDVLRWIPLAIYEGMVDLASNGKMSSFGYSDLGENKYPIKGFLGAQVVRLDHYPPVPSPPGFNVIVSKTNGQLQFVWAYVDEALSEDEIKEMESSFKKNLGIT